MNSTAIRAWFSQHGFTICADKPARNNLSRTAGASPLQKLFRRQGFIEFQPDEINDHPQADGK